MCISQVLSLCINKKWIDEEVIECHYLSHTISSHLHTKPERFLIPCIMQFHPSSPMQDSDPPPFEYLTKLSPSYGKKMKNVVTICISSKMYSSLSFFLQEVAATPDSDWNWNSPPCICALTIISILFFEKRESKSGSISSTISKIVGRYKRLFRWVFHLSNGSSFLSCLMTFSLKYSQHFLVGHLFESRL